jgi:hypothetical protein
VTLTTHPHLVPRLSISRSYTSSPPCASMGCSGTALLFLFTFYFCIQCSIFNNHGALFCNTFIIFVAFSICPPDRTSKFGFSVRLFPLHPRFTLYTPHHTNFHHDSFNAFCFRCYSRNTANWTIHKRRPQCMSYPPPALTEDNEL